jgi:hypothetical protein
MVDHHGISSARLVHTDKLSLPQSLKTQTKCRWDLY